MSRLISYAAAALLLAALPAPSAARERVDDPANWQTYRDERHGISFRYPAMLSPSADAARAAAGPVLLSSDGRVRLVVSATQRAADESLSSYRAFLLKEIYAGARITFSPTAQDWFVVSGTRGRDHFYEHVTFACGGKVIIGWSLTYPDNERDTFDRVVEGVSRSFTPKPGQRCN